MQRCLKFTWVFVIFRRFEIVIGKLLQLQIGLLIVEWLQEMRINLLVILQNETEFLILVLDKVTCGEYWTSLQNEIGAFNIKIIIFLQMPVHVKMIFDDEGHETEAQIYDVSKNNEVVRLDFHSISILGLEGAVIHMKVIYGEIVAL